MLLVGNPNVGKSVLFRALTNHYATVSNFPGTTVEVVKAPAVLGGEQYEVTDTPGINDLEPRSDDARVTLSLVKEAPEATIVQVADAKNLRRALMLTIELSELGRPMVLVLNMMDEMEERGGRIDFERLSRILDVPVVGTVACTGRGVERLIEALPEAQIPRRIRLDCETGASAYDTAHARVREVNRMLSETYSIEQPARASFRTRLGFAAMHPVKGLGLLVLVLTAVFWFVGLFGAGTMVDLLEVSVFEMRVSPAAISTLDRLLPFPHEHKRIAVTNEIGLPVSPVSNLVVLEDHETGVRSPSYVMNDGVRLSFSQQASRFVHDFMVGEYGLITMALSYALAIVLPIVTTFFLVFSLLEDSGYFPRMAVLVNRIFRFMGLNGRAVLPMILGLGCDTMATMTTRVLETRKERLITTMLLALAVPCSAQLGVLMAMIAAVSWTQAAVWMMVVMSVILLIGWLTARLLNGDTSDFLLEIPPIRKPQYRNVVSKTVTRLDWYLREVIPIFIAGTAILFVLDRVGALHALARVGEPLVHGWLGLPPETAMAFLVGFLRRDFGAVYLLSAATGPSPQLDHHQVLVAMVTITLFMPCIANFLMIAKEHGMRVALCIAAFIFPFAFLVGGLINRLGI